MAQMPIGKPKGSVYAVIEDLLRCYRALIGNITACTCPAAGRLTSNSYE